MIIEKERHIPVVSNWDVIVCGAGPAGFSAAVTAARQGARTCLIETHGCLGGIWTTGSLGYILDGKNKRGLLTELLSRLDTVQGRQNFVCDIESVKLVLEQMCWEAGVHVRLHSRVVAAHCTENNKLDCIVTESKSGREAWRAKVFIDATGDGDVAAQAGCQFEVGDARTGDVQPMSLVALVTGIEPGQSEPYTKIERQSRHNLLAEIRRGGYEPSYANPGLWHIRDELYILMANHQYGCSALNADDITRATLEARKELQCIIAALRSLGGIWNRLRLVSTATQIGVREGRRIKGRYEVTVGDMMQGRKHEDAVCTVSFGVDVHVTKYREGQAFAEYNQQFRGKVKRYDIPLRALIARDVDGLMMAGRCISGDFLAHSSYRVTGNAVSMGEAAGAVSALAARSGLLPHQVSWPRAQQALQLQYSIAGSE